MKEFIKKFTTHEDYEEYITGDSAVLPNVSYCVDTEDVHYNKFKVKITAKFEITSTTHPTSITYQGGWDNIDNVLVIKPNGTTFTLHYSDLVLYDDVQGVDPFMAYTFDETGEYTFIYTLKDDSTTIMTDLFTTHNVTSVNIHDGVTHINNTAFLSDKLSSVTISSSVTHIEEDAFQYCPKLQSIYCYAMTAPTLSGNPFNSVGTEVAEGTQRKLIIYSSSTGYDESYWDSVLCNYPIDQDDDGCKFMIYYIGDDGEIEIPSDIRLKNMPSSMSEFRTYEEVGLNGETQFNMLYNTTYNSLTIDGNSEGWIAAGENGVVMISKEGVSYHYNISQGTVSFDKIE